MFNKLGLKPVPQISHEIREDLDILDIDFKRWQSQAYQLREDEVLEIVEIMNAFCLATNNGILVYGPSYARDADLLRNVVWESSDNEPILAGGGVSNTYLFGTGSNEHLS